MSKKQIAFTLIELLVVIAIIGILSGLIVVSMGGMTQKATIAKAQVFSNSLRNSLMMSIVAEWKFDGSTAGGSAANNNDVLDTWGGMNNGTVTVPARTHTPTVRVGSNCVSGSCLEFNGVDDYIDFADNSSLDFGVGNFTISGWFKYPSQAGGTTNYAILYGKNLAPSPYAGIDIFADHDGVSGGVGNVLFRVDANNRVASVASNLNSNNWWFGAFIRDGTILKIVVNGIFDNSATVSSIDVSNSDILRLGANSNSSTNQNFTGLMDDIRVYNSAISISQIKERYYLGLSDLFANKQITSEEYLSRIKDVSKK